MKRMTTDVLVCGGGCAGIGAALAAARNNARTLLVERAGFAGGIITAVGLPYFDGVASAIDGRIVVRGIPFEMLVKLGVCKPDATHLRPHNPTIRSTERFKFEVDRWLTAHGAMIQLLYHTHVCDATVRGGRIDRVIVASKDGLVAIEAKQVIDATGDADVAHWSGVPVEKTEPLMPLTMHLRIGNVRPTATLARDARQALIDAQRAKKLPMFYGPGIAFTFADDEAYVHAVRVPGDATDAADLTRCEIQGRRDVWAIFEAWQAHVPGFENAYLISTGPYIGVRETRRLVGRYVLTEEDIRRQAAFDDAIATGCWYMDRHPNHTTVGSANDPDRGYQPKPYDIPYRSLVARGVDNLLVAGRCHSASAAAASSTRVTVTAMAMGQAAGTAAAMAVHTRRGAGQLDGQAVRERLISQGAGPIP